ncbi:3-keto-L-gulonate-6-phosphate decarboxylase [Escherichia coli]|uniref:3-keto-L-gulonate-6-phosphate decarboxylase n=1 Tax=Escherichia coli TaxID=562 RepID=A0A376TRU8_ECOLX|nr:3-keto-L-gulonate-6-phosphate decarboxylase [Escherichia coli]
MSRPLLQLALDHSSLEAAQRDVTQLKDSVDIVEAGTILCLNEGLGAVKALREQCPDQNHRCRTGRSPTLVKRSRNRHLAQALTG